MKRITVFGGANPKPGTAAYEEALQLGRLLGERGYSVLTGGYIGTMEAVSRGAAESGGHVIGVTCEEIESWRGVSANAWVKEELRYATLKERLFALIEECDAALALPGGVGTLAEIALTWNLLLIDAIPPRPLILIGSCWQETVRHLYASFDDYIPEMQRQWIQFSQDIWQAVDLLGMKG